MYSFSVKLRIQFQCFMLDLMFQVKNIINIISNNDE